MIPRQIAFLGLLLLLLVSPPSVLAQVQSQSLDTQRERQATQEMFAQELVRRAVLAIQSERNPTRESYRLAARTLDVAAGLANDDPHILRLMIEAAGWADERELVIDGTRRLVAKDPTDLVAKLRLLDDAVRARQSGEERLAAYERLLGPDGENLHATIRSRLAYDAAVLAREQGDLERFTALLAQSIGFDATNKQAAALAAAFHAGRRADQPVEQLELLINLLHADPMDASTIIAIARHLLSHGAYAESGRFVGAAIGVLNTERTRLDDSTFMIRVLSLWADDRDSDALQALDNYQGALTVGERQRRLQLLEEENRRKQRFGEPFTPIDWNNPPFQDLVIDLPVSLEWLRAMIAQATERDAMAEVAAGKVIARLEQYVETARQDIETARQDETLAADVKRAQLETALSDLSSLLGESILVRVLFDVRLDEVPALLEEYLSDGRVRDAARHRFQGWLALRRGESEEANRHFEQAETDDLARLGMALLERQAGDSRQAIRHLAAVWKSQPDTQIGLFAKSQLEQMLGRPAPAFSETAVEMNRVAREQVGGDLLNLWSEPTRVISLTLEPSTNQLEYLDRPTLTVTVRNNSNYPLALGPEAPISSRLMLAARLKLDGRSVQARFLPLIVDLHRRFRLDPRQSLVVEVDVNRDQHLEFAWATPGMNLMLRYRGILDYTPATESALYVAGPMGVEALADEIIAFGVPGPFRDPVGLMLNLDKAWGMMRFRLLGVAIAVVGTPEDRQLEPVSASDRARIREAMLERVGAFTDLERAWILVRGQGMTPLPNDDPLMAAAAAAAGEFTTLAYVATRARNLDDPILTAALEHDSERVRTLARARREVLLAQAAQEEQAEPTAGDETPSK